MARLDPMIVTPLFVLTIVLAGLAYTNISKTRFLNESIAQSSPKPDPTPLTIILVEATPSVIPSSSASATPTTSPLKFTTNSNTASDFSYPGATIKSSSTSQIIYESSDSPNTITEWYKNKIKSLNLNTTSSAMTNTNNNIQNSLAASGNNKNVNIEIKKSSADKVTTIIVKI